MFINFVLHVLGMVNHSNILVVLIYPVEYQNFDILYMYYDDVLRLQFLTYQRVLLLLKKIIACMDLEDGVGHFLDIFRSAIALYVPHIQDICIKQFFWVVHVSDMILFNCTSGLFISFILFEQICTV